METIGGSLSTTFQHAAQIDNNTSGRSLGAVRVLSRNEAVKWICLDNIIKMVIV